MPSWPQKMHRIHSEATTDSQVTALRVPLDAAMHFCTDTKLTNWEKKGQHGQQLRGGGALTSPSVCGTQYSAACAQKDSAAKKAQPKDAEEVNSTKYHRLPGPTQLHTYGQ